MKVKAQLMQPEVWGDTPLAECIVEVSESDSEETIRLKAAHELLKKFDLITERIKEKPIKEII